MLGNIIRVDWIMKADDDTYVIVENLKKFLSNYSKNDPVYFGCQFNIAEPAGTLHWASGGAGEAETRLNYIISSNLFEIALGYVLSLEALRRFVVDGLPNPEYCYQGNDVPEDATLGICLRSVGVTLEDSRDSLGRHRFLVMTPEDHLFPRTLSDDDKKYWYWIDLTYPQSTGMNCCANDAISYHYITARQMYVLEYFLYHIRPAGIDREEEYVQEYPLEFTELTSTSIEPAPLADSKQNKFTKTVQIERGKNYTEQSQPAIP